MNWYKKLFSSVSPQEYAKGLLSNNFHPGKNDNEPAMWDAIDGDIPYFNMITAKQKGFGYPAFLHFLMLVGQNKNFMSSDFTSEGRKLFQKAVSQNIIKQLPSPKDYLNKINKIKRITLWEIVGDPNQSLQQFSITPFTKNETNNELV